jgi:hypothetical protein
MALSTLTPILLVVALTIAGFILLSVVYLRKARRQAHRLGYRSLSDYLRAAPRSDEERRDAVDLTLKGVVVCVLGLLFPPLILVGLVPLYYGGRKMAYASLGLGLVNDADPEHPNE